MSFVFSFLVLFASSVFGQKAKLDKKLNNELIGMKQPSGMKPAEKLESSSCSGGPRSASAIARSRGR